MIGFLFLLSVAYVAADPIIVGVQNQPDVDDGYVIGQRPVYASYYPSGYAASPYAGYYGVAPAPQQYPRQAYFVAQQPVVAQTAVVQQQPIGIMQNQASGPTQVYKPGPSPPMVVNPAPVVVRPPPPPPIIVQPQKIFVQPPQVPPVYASNPQVYYAQSNCPGCSPQLANAGQVAAVPVGSGQK